MYNITKEMVDYYYKRTNEHINRVKKYIEKIYIKYPIFKLLKDRLQNHDQSKFKDPELIPYILITWKYYCKNNNIPFDLPENINNIMQEATYHHVKNNRHHPEFHDNTTTINSINPKDRDTPPEKIVNGSNMSDIDIAEMVADWMAVSEEKNSHPKDWAKANIDKRWKFTKHQKDLIYNIIENVWDE